MLSNGFFLTDLARDKSISFVKNHSRVTKIYTSKITAKRILAVVRFGIWKICRGAISANPLCFCLVVYIWGRPTRLIK